MFNYNYVLTRNEKDFESFKISKIGNFKVNSFQFISNITFNQVYYLFYNNKLTAFKVIAISVIKNKYLIQTPLEKKWVSLSDYHLFFNKEHYFSYLEGNNSPIKYEYERINLDMFKLYSNDGCGYSLLNSYIWGTNGKPNIYPSYINDIIYTDNGFIVFYTLRKDAYSSYSKCLQASISNVNVVDFGEEEINVSISITKEQTPKVYNLRIIEDF